MKLNFSQSALHQHNHWFRPYHDLFDSEEYWQKGFEVIDELLGGTNSRDRRVAAEAVIRTLVERGAVGAISSHDLALTEIADDDRLGGRNVHLGSREGGGPMDFDYLVKPGVTQETNALAIARMAGVPV